MFIKKKKLLKAEFIGRGGAWLDTGNIEIFTKRFKLYCYN